MIEIGEYARTKNGKIDKVINNNCYMPQYIECEKSLLYKEDIVNHSKDLVDLIEEGDIVEYQVNSLSELKVGRVKSYRDARSNKEYLGVEGFDITKIYIKKILTKEQMEANCYTVERNEE